MKATHPKIAVLLTAYNGLKYLDEQIGSILNQIDVHPTIFVSVDISSDGTETWFKEQALLNSRIILLPYGEKFGGAAKNFFHLIREVDFSTFEFVAFSDQDDIWLPTKLSKAVAILTTQSYHAYSSNVTAFWPDGRKKLINKAQPQKRWDYLFEAAGPGCTYVMKADFMSALKSNMLGVWDRGLQDVHLHDWYTYAFARANNYKWFIDPEPSLLYRQHQENQVGVNSGLKAYVTRLKQIKSGDWFKQASLIALLVGVGDSAFVKGWSGFARVGFLRLAMKAFQCRRRIREQVVIFIACIFCAIK